MTLKDIYHEFEQKEKASELGVGENAIEEQKDAVKQSA